MLSTGSKALCIFILGNKMYVGESLNALIPRYPVGLRLGERLGRGEDIWTKARWRDMRNTRWWILQSDKLLHIWRSHCTAEGSEVCLMKYKSAYITSVAKLLTKSSTRREDIIQMVLRDGRWIHLLQDRVRWLVLVFVVLNLRILFISTLLFR